MARNNRDDPRGGEGPFVKLVMGGKDACLITPNGPSCVEREPPEYPATGNRAWSGAYYGDEQITKRGLKGGE